MSELIIIGYDDHATAEAAQARVLQLQKDFVIDLSGLAVVRVDDDGKKHIDTPGSIVGVSATSGALWGMIIGLLFLVPGVGLLVGKPSGGLVDVAEVRDNSRARTPFRLCARFEHGLRIGDPSWPSWAPQELRDLPEPR